MSRNGFYKAAGALYLTDDHPESDEVGVYYQWKTYVRQNAPLESNFFFRTPHAAWYSKLVIFNHWGDSVSRTVNGKRIWCSLSAAAVSVCVRDLKNYFHHTAGDTTVIMLLEGRSGLNKPGHCVVRNFSNIPVLFRTNVLKFTFDEL